MNTGWYGYIPARFIELVLIQDWFYRMFSIQRRIQNPVKYKMKYIAKIVIKTVNYFCKVFRFRCLAVFWICLCNLFQNILQWYPVGIYLLRLNNKNTRTRCEICSKLTRKTPERRHWRRSGVFIFNSEQISHLVLVFLELTLNI